MPITINIKGKDLFNPVTGRFITIKDTTVVLEHSLISVSNWESKWHKPYLSTDKKTQEQYFDYLRCMCLTKNIDPVVFYALSNEDIKRIADYIADPMTATTIKNKDNKKSKEIITNELIYFWMSSLSIPFDPCQKWHLNRLLTLIEVASIKNQPPKKMSKADIMRQNHSLNAARRAKYNTKG